MLRNLLLVTALMTSLAPGDAKAALRVVTTTPEYGAIASSIGGDRVTVESLAKPGEDPHFVDAKPSHVVTLNRADVLVEGGADLEVGWLPPLVDGARNTKILPGAEGRVLASEGVQLLDVPATLDRSRGDTHAAGNPHFMMDPANAGIFANHIAEVFCKLDGAGCASYKTNLSRFQATLGERMKTWTAKLAPYKGTPLVTYHSTWRYFAQRFGFRLDTFLEPKPGIPPSPPHLAEVIAKMKSENIRLILVEPFQSRKTAEVVAEHTGAKVVDVCQFPGGLAKTDGDYFGLVDADVNAILAALGAASSS